MNASTYLRDTLGFSLIELMIALTILAFGLIAAGQLFLVAASSGSLASSKGSAAVAAQNMLEHLADLYSRNSSSGDLALGSHGPSQTQVMNPTNGAILNRYTIAWDVSRVSDPRPGKELDARLVRVMVAPIQSNGAPNSRPLFNKILNASTILSPAIR
jgi:prepilin-type N-terminal cleavage/methylation domain-containing protein